MSKPHSRSRPVAARGRARLYWSASLATLIAAAGSGGGANAQSIGALLAATHQANVLATATANPASGASGATASAAMLTAAANALRHQTQLTSAQSLAAQAQAAALASVKALEQNDPLALNKQFGVIDGLGAGGLRPAITGVAPAAGDATGKATWQGAQALTAAADVTSTGAGPNGQAVTQHTVSVVQTDARAILSWTDFNIGQYTTLQFQAAPGTTGGAGWITLNRVVGTTPTTVLGKIAAPWTVLILNQNGILFGPTSQVNVGALVASNLEIGHALEASAPTTLRTRNQEFLDFGLLGWAQQNATASDQSTFSEIATSSSTFLTPTSSVGVSAGAALTSAGSGYLMLLGTTVADSGQMTSPDGEVALQSGAHVTLAASQGASTSIDPDVRGLVVTAATQGVETDSVTLGAGAMISVPRGYASIGATSAGGVLDSGGLIEATTSVSENGYVNIFGGRVTLQDYTDAKSATTYQSVIAITPDTGATTVPLASGSTFKTSRVRIGGYAAGSTSAGSGAYTPPATLAAALQIGGQDSLDQTLIYAPSATISIGADAGAAVQPLTAGAVTPGVVIGAGATIDAAGLPGVLIPASRNSIKIDPVNLNELADSPAFRNGFLKGATVYLDPRLSGVNANGVAWVGSPLIAAAAYARQVGVTVQELMVKGGSVTIGASSPSAATSVSQAPAVVIRPGATIDVSGGWKTYEAGAVQQTYLVDTSGQVIPISQANPDSIYVGIYKGFTDSQPRWGVNQSYVDPLLTGTYQAAQYTEGYDAGALTLKAAALAFDGQLDAAAFAGPLQILAARPGTATGAVYGDVRSLQAAGSQLPAGGYLDIQQLSLTTGAGGGDITLFHGAPATAEPNGTLSSTALSDQLLSGAGLGQITLATSGAITVASNALISLQPGGAFEAIAGRAAPDANGVIPTGTGAITVDGTILAPGGAIDLTTADLPGSVFLAHPSVLPVGSYDIAVNGTLSVAGRWANDLGVTSNIAGSSYGSGGEITLHAAPRVTTPSLTASGAIDPSRVTDISGSILIGDGATLDLAGGGYVSPTGAITFSAKGGNLSLFADTTYFQIANSGDSTVGGFSGFRVDGVTAQGSNVLAVNPSVINAHISIGATATIRDAGFAGGGAFTLATPYFNFGSSATSAGQGAALPLDFFSREGFASYRISSYGTALLANLFSDSPAGYSAVLESQVLTVGAGQTLSLTQSYFSPWLSNAQSAALLTLPTYGAPGVYNGLYSILTPSVPTDAWDQKPVSLSLGGLLELKIAQGGQVLAGLANAQGRPTTDTAGQLIGPTGSSLNVSLLNSDGLIWLPGGTVTQSEILPAFYAQTSALATDTLFGPTGLFGGAGPGSASEYALSSITSGKTRLTNAALAANTPIYLLTDPGLAPGVGVNLGSDSVTNLAGVAVINPRAAPQGALAIPGFVDGKVVGGGSLISTDVFANGGSLFRATPDNNSTYAQLSAVGGGIADTLNAGSGARILLDGAQATFYRATPPTTVALPGQGANYAPTEIWSNGGALTLDAGGRISDATIQAQGGAPYALGGVLTVLRPTLYDPGASLTGAESATLASALTPLTNAAIETSGFATFVAEGGLNAVGTVDLTLARALFVETPTALPGKGLLQNGAADAFSPVISASGALTISAPYIGLLGAFQAVGTARPQGGAAGTGQVVLRAETASGGAGAIDVSGAVVFGPSVASATLSANGDIRLIGVEPPADPTNPPTPSLFGELVVNGDLSLQAAQIYPTTGTTFAVTSTGLSAPATTAGPATNPTSIAAGQGLIRFLGLPGVAAPPTPYSAGGNLLIAAANIDQGGVIRAPLGALSLGASLASLRADHFAALAQPTDNLWLEAGSVTSVSANVSSGSSTGLDIPYGVTTDQKEWYFSPTSSSPLTAPPAGALDLSGGAIDVASGADIDLRGGGDVYAYEFISGTGGSRDVLDRFNSDQFSSTNGYQYPDGRQVYAIIVPQSAPAGARTSAMALAGAPVAPMDPVYSADYGALYGPTQVGQQVYLNAAPGVPAGWYTLLPAKYALLPGGMRVVQDTGAIALPPVGGQVLADGPAAGVGTIVTSGYFGAWNGASRSSNLVVFDVQSQAMVNSESSIALTYATPNFAALAASDKTLVPRLPIDAARLILAPARAMSLDGIFQTSSVDYGAGASTVSGRGAAVDISGTSLYIYQAGGTPAPSADLIAAFGAPIELTDTSLDNLGAASLLLGGVRGAANPYLSIATNGTFAGVGVDNADGTTSVLATSNAITVSGVTRADATFGANLSAPEILMITNGTGSVPGRITIADGAIVTATGAVTDPASGAYLIDGVAYDSQGVPSQTQSAMGGFVRVSAAPQRLATRRNADASVGAGSIEVGGARLTGASVELTTPGSLAISDSIQLDTTALALGADQIAFGATDSFAARDAFMVTPALQGLLSKIKTLDLSSRATMEFAAGSYAFRDLTLQTPALAESTSGGVSITTGALDFAQGGSSLQGVGCGQYGMPDCGRDTLAITATSVAFGSGAFTTYGFGAGVTLTATNGVFVDGAATFDAGAAELTLNTPFLGDRGTGVAGAPLPSLTLETTTSVNTTLHYPPSPPPIPAAGTTATTLGAVTTTTVATKPNGGTGVVVARVTTTTQGTITLASATPAQSFTDPYGATPGSNITIDAASVNITGTDVRSTAGVLRINAVGSIGVSGGARLETPSYVKTYGDAADPARLSAPGGALGLVSQGGDVSISSDSVLAIGGAQGRAGALDLVAQNGVVQIVYPGGSSAGAVDPNGRNIGLVLSTGAATGGSLTIDTGGGFDLAGFAAGTGKGFTGAIAIHTGQGDLSLSSGERIAAADVRLIADGGQILDSGTIDTTGPNNGGDISLYGAAGVTLTGSARILARAPGYGATSTLQAHGGDVTLGVTGNAAITVAAGASIDVSAATPGNRLVSLDRSGGVYETFVAGDTGGTVTFRAPVVNGASGETVNVAFAGGVTGAASVVLEGYRRFNLTDYTSASIDTATGLPYAGVTIAGNIATIDLSATAGGSVNAFGISYDAAGNLVAGPAVSFVQSFGRDVAIPANLSSLANFHARPGIEIDFGGDIVLASNWNLGAGVVDVPAAVAANLLIADPGLPGRLMINPTTTAAATAAGLTNEGLLLQSNTNALYRVGKKFTGEAGTLTMRAGGSLTLNGSLTDGFFQFADQTDPGYLNYALGGGYAQQGYLAPTAGADGTLMITFPINTALATAPGAPAAPYSAAANAPAALGSLANGTGDPLGSAVLFPLLAHDTPVASWSYTLVGGARLASSAPTTVGAAPAPTPLTLAVAPTPIGSVTAQGQHVYGYSATTAKNTLIPTLDLQDAAGDILSVGAWYSAYLAQTPGAASQSTVIDFSNTSVLTQRALQSLASTVLNRSVTTSVLDLTLADAVTFLTAVSNSWNTPIPATLPGGGVKSVLLSALFPAPANPAIPIRAVQYAVAPTLIRTGSGSIAIAAAGNIDLRNGATPVRLTGGGKISSAIQNVAGVAQTQLGGVAVYTAGHIAVLDGAATALDARTGATVSVDLAANGQPTHNLALYNNPLNPNAGAYAYGAGSSGVAGILIADPVYAQGGGGITLTAGQDVLGRRDTALEDTLSGVGVNPYVSGAFAWIGSGDQPWRTGAVAAPAAGGLKQPDLRIDPQLFAEGVGTLGGGDITVQAGRNVSDISVVATDSIVTAILSSGASTSTGLATAAFGGGNVQVSAGGRLQGGRLDVAAGNAVVTAAADVVSGPDFWQFNGGAANGGASSFVDNNLRVRVADGRISINSGGAVTLDGISALGVESAQRDDAGFYWPGAGVAILADGPVSVLNGPLDFTTGASLAAGATAYAGADVTSAAVDTGAVSAIYPGSFEAVSFTAGLDIAPPPAPGGASSAVLLYPDPTGTLTLLAAGDIAPTVIAQLDSDPTILPGFFSSYAELDSAVTSGLSFGYPAILPNTSDVTLRQLHNPAVTHAADSPDNPNRIVAGGDINDLILTAAKSTRVAAGRDITNMIYVGQNVTADDITRVYAGRDITATTTLAQPIVKVVNGSGQAAAALPEIQGDTFVVGGPGALFVEAGRNLGPFLNSAVTNGFSSLSNGAGYVATGQLTYGGGVLAVGNLYNAGLPSQSADIYAAFGVANGANFSGPGGLIGAYLNPADYTGANLAAQPGYLFLQTTDLVGAATPDRTKPIYALSLTDWEKSVAADVITRYDNGAATPANGANASPFINYMYGLSTGGSASFSQALAYLPQLSGQAMPLIPWLMLHYSNQLSARYGALSQVTYQNAYDFFTNAGAPASGATNVPLLNQEAFLITNVYFNELAQTSIPTSPSYQVYSRGYRAVNTLFPSTLGYTQNSLNGGAGGAVGGLVRTGDLDLRLATIQTQEGGNISLLGPGGRVIAGSTVATAVQASRRAYDGGALYSGNLVPEVNNQPGPITAAITTIPAGFEGVLTLRGGNVDSFTDGDFLLNQSRAFTVDGGDIAIWSSNAGVNAGQGPRTVADVPPLVVRIDENGDSQVSTTNAVSGAGIGAFSNDANGLAPDVLLMAPRGTVDSGAAGVRSAGAIYVVAQSVAGATGFQAKSGAVGIGGTVAVNVSAQAGGDTTAAAAAQAAQAASAGARAPDRPLILVDVLGVLAEETAGCSDEEHRRGTCL